jgi:peptidoglycan/LPS O-acetylase OafA/YrhL
LNSLTAGRVSGLEAMRGIAATAIAVFHMMALNVPLPDGIGKTVISSFAWAVPFFFALSAFSLLCGYHRKIWSEEGLFHFYLRRVFRIMPLFYFMLVMYSVFVYGGSIGASEFVVNVLFMFPFFPGKHESIVAAGWSLGVEWIFYLLFPFFAMLASRHRLSLAVFLVLCVLTVASGDLALASGLGKAYGHMNMPRNLLFFQSGVLAYVLIQELRSRPQFMAVTASIRRACPWLLLASVLFFLGASVLPDGVLVLLPRHPLVAYACVLWICLAVVGLPRALDNPLTLWLGRHSFGIYLIHPFALILLARLGFFGLVSTHISATPAAFAVSASVFLLLVCAMAAAAYRLIESPCIALGDRILTRKATPFVPPETGRPA